MLMGGIAMVIMIYPGTIVIVAAVRVGLPGVGTDREGERACYEEK